MSQELTSCWQIFFENGDPVKVVNLQTNETATTPATILKVLTHTHKQAHPHIFVFKYSPV